MERALAKLARAYLDLAFYLVVLVVFVGAFVEIALAEWRRG